MAKELPNSPKISRVTIGSKEYFVKDEWARDAIEALGTPTHFLGVTTTPLTDGADTNPIVVNGESVTAHGGDIAVYGHKEFIFSGLTWIELGDLSVLGDLAYKDDATGTTTPAGTVSQPTFTGNSLTVSGSYTPEGTVALSGGTAQTLVASVDDTTATVKVLDTAGSVTAGSAASFTQGSDTFTQGTDTFNAGTLPSWSKVADTFNGGTAADWSASVNETTETLSFSWTPNTIATYTEGAATWSAGTAPSYTQGTDTFTQGSDSFTANVPTEVVLDTFKNQSVVTEVTSTDDTVTVPTTATFTGTADTIESTGTPTGTVSQPTFTGTEATITVS